MISTNTVTRVNAEFYGRMKVLIGVMKKKLLVNYY